ncbi:hypothetical protein NCC49_002048 [Naganishia albida]|nr:hypothetical protein NCC49_002048 [Naganishia albida]
MPPVPPQARNETYILDSKTQSIQRVPDESLLISLRYPTPNPALTFFLECIPDPAGFLATQHLAIRRILDPDNKLANRYRGITLAFSSDVGLADTQGEVITLSLPWIFSWSTRNRREATHEFQGVLTHELVHVVQYDGNQTAAHWWIKGLADHVRLVLDLAPPHWAGPGSGSSWEGGYETTAHFFTWLAAQKGSKGLLVDVNARLVDEEWRDDWFERGTGLSVATLWGVYKARYA